MAMLNNQRVENLDIASPLLRCLSPGLVVFVLQGASDDGRWDALGRVDDLLVTEAHPQGSQG